MRKLKKKTIYLFFLVILLAIPIFSTHLSDTAIRITDLSVIKPKKVHIGNRLKIEGSVQYLGTGFHSFYVSLMVNRTQDQIEKISVASFQTVNVSFFWTPERNGVYMISLRVYRSPSSFEESIPLNINVDSISGYKKYTMALYHFNVQYVPGSSTIENRIIEKSFYPLLKMYERHSTWRCNIELSGYMLEILYHKYPQLLDLLKNLVNEGQIELIVSHYSEQLLVAYPRTDMAKSIEISDTILDSSDLVRSGVFFAQESQWTPGYAGLLNTYDYNTVVVSSDPWYYYLPNRMKMNSPLFYLEDNSSQSLGSDKRLLNVLLHKKDGYVKV